MATVLTSQLSFAFAFDYQNDGPFNTVVDAVSYSKSFALTSGVDIDQATKMFRGQRTVTTGADDDLDLATGLVDAFGVPLVFTCIKGLWIHPLPTNTTNLTIGLSAAPFATWLGGTTPTVGPIVPGGVLFVYNPSAAGYVVTATTADILRITNAAGASAVYDIFIFGEG